jgi:hypothetical protein
VRLNCEGRGKTIYPSNILDFVDNVVENPGVSHNPCCGVDSVDNSLCFSTPFPPFVSGRDLAARAVFPYRWGMSSTSPQLYDYDYLYLLSSPGNHFRVEILTSMHATSLPEHLCVS